MNHYKPVQWSAPVDTLLSLIPVAEYATAQVRPINIAVQHTIFKLLNIGISKCEHYNIMLVYFPPNSKIDIHSDKPVDIPEEIRISQGIILPLQSCDNLIWNWYKAVNPEAIYHYGEEGNWKRVPFLRPWGSELIETVSCSKPFISDIGTFHALENRSDQTALAISIRLMPWSYGTVQTCDALPPIPGVSLL